MANGMVFLSDLQTGRSSSSVQVRLLRFWEARNVRRGGEAYGSRHAPSRFSGDYDAGEAHDASSTRSSQSSGNGLMVKSYISLCTWSLFPETMHHLALEIIGVGKKKLYAAKVWMKPRLNFKESQEFKSANDVSPTITPFYLGCK
ncbi:unnamed protein product [Brassica oleracea]